MRYTHKVLSGNVYAVVGISKFILNKLLSFGYFKETPIKTFTSITEENLSQMFLKWKGISQKIFCSLGTLAPHKRAELFLRTFQRVKGRVGNLL